jgi:hypothetical protein
MTKEAIPEPELYQPYARSRILDSLGSAVELKWGGDLAIGGGTAYVFASLTTERWQILTPDMIRREVQLSSDPAKRTKSKITQPIPRGTSLFGQPRLRDPFLFLGEMAPTRNSGSRSIGHIAGARWNDYLIKPRLPRQVWNRLRFRALYIDERIAPIDSWIDRGDANRFFETIERIRRRRRVVAKVYRRVGGTLTYVKQHGTHSLVHESGTTSWRAILPYKSWPKGAAADEQTAVEALMVFWSFGIFLPSIRWGKG